VGTVPRPRCPREHAADSAPAAKRPAPLPDRVARAPARIRHGGALLRRHTGTGYPPALDGACRAGGVHADFPPARLGPVERLDLGPFALPSPADGFSPARRFGGRRDDRQQVPPALERQASLQPDELRNRRSARRGRGRLGLFRPVGQHRVLRVPDRVCGALRRAARFARGRGARLPRLLRGVARRAGARRARPADDSPSQAGKRRASPLRVLHDLGPEDDPRLARRPSPFRRSRRLRRRVCAAPPFPAERRFVVPRAFFAPGPAPRSRPAGPAPVGSHGLCAERRNPCAASRSRFP
jgi:hypothetical protein